MILRTLALALPTSLVLATAACAPAPHAEPQHPIANISQIPVQVTASYRERILMPPGSTLQITIQDVSLADAPAVVMAEHVQTLDGRGPPYSVVLEVPRSQVQLNHTYIARAELRTPDGRLRFTTDTRHEVITRGAPDQADIVMVGV